MEKANLIDLSHTVEAGMVTYKGIPAPIICDFLSREESRKNYSEGTEFFIGKIELVANTGTYLDSPFHRYSTGKDLSELDLTSLANLETLLVRPAGPERAIPATVFSNLSGQLKGRAILINTGWDRHWRTARYSEGHPFLTAEAARFLAEAEVALVGIDSYNIDDTSGGTRPAHSILLGAGIPIVEHLCELNKLPGSGFRFFAVPVKVKDFGTFPVRAFALL